MPTRNQIKLVKSLKRKKERLSHGLFVVEGRKSVSEGLKAGLRPELLFCLKDLEDEHIAQKAEKISPEEMSRMTALSNPSEALAVFAIDELTPSEPKGNRFIALDAIRDPGNLGTIIRIADWFGWDGVLCSEDCVDIFNTKAVQSSMGSLFRVKVHYGKLASFFEKLEDNHVIGTSMDGENMWSIDRQTLERCILVIGSEAHGISPEIEKLCQKMVSIPGGSAESLNAGVATGILVAGFSR